MNFEKKWIESSTQIPRATVATTTDGPSIDRRRLHNCVLAYLSTLGGEATRSLVVDQSDLRFGASEVYLHEMPGGQFTNLKEQERRVRLIPKIGGNVPSKKLSIFTRQFSVMLDAGLPLVQCLEILGGQEDHKVFKKIIDDTRADVEVEGAFSG